MRTLLAARALASPRARDAHRISAPTRSRRRARAVSGALERERERDDDVPALLRYDAHRSLALDDRARRDAASLAALARDDSAVAFACDASGTRALCERDEGTGWWRVRYASAREAAEAAGGVDFDGRDGGFAYVGRDRSRGDRPVFVVDVDRGGKAREVFDGNDGVERMFRDVKTTTGRAAFDAEDASIVAAGAGLLRWREKQKFCRNCGREGPKIVKGGRKATCEACGESSYPELMPCCLALITCGNYVLLGRNRRWPQNFYSLLAGFVEGSESLEGCVAREAFEEASVVVDPAGVEYVASQPWPFPNQLMMGFRAAVVADRLGPLKMPPETKTLDGELADARWFHVDYLASRISPERARLDPRGDESAEPIPFGEIALPGEHALARVLIQNWVDEKMSYRRRRCDDRLVTTVVEGSFFTECELSSGDDESGDAFAFRDDVAESQALHFVMCEVLLAREGQAPVVIRAAPAEVSKIRDDVVAEVEKVGDGARALAYVRATGRITCKRDADGSQRINVKMLSEASDEEFDARAIVVAMLQKACPFHEFTFVGV